MAKEIKSKIKDKQAKALFPQIFDKEDQERIDDIMSYSNYSFKNDYIKSGKAFANLEQFNDVAKALKELHEIEKIYSYMNWNREIKEIKEVLELNELRDLSTESRDFYYRYKAEKNLDKKAILWKKNDRN